MERLIRRQHAPYIDADKVVYRQHRRPFFLTSIELFSSCSLFPHVSSLPSTQVPLGAVMNLGIAGNLVSPLASVECRCYVRESGS